MVGMNCVASDDNKDANDQTQAVNATPPNERREWVVFGKIVIVVLLYPSDNTRDKSNEPGELHRSVSERIAIERERNAPC
jgi:hypothetical protein